jgi:hypothetical protein
MKVIYTILAETGWAWCLVFFVFLAFRLWPRRRDPRGVEVKVTESHEKQS